MAITGQEMISAPVIPVGMREVSETEFFALLKADPRDIMPSVANPHFTTWETPQRQVWGWTTPGWKNPGTERRYTVVRS